MKDSPEAVTFGAHHEFSGLNTTRTPLSGMRSLTEGSLLMLQHLGR